jgi:hypothetical protein
MKQPLTEITSRMLFTEYLHHLNIRVPNLHQEWVYTRGKQVLACIRIGAEQPRFFIQASGMTSKR